jgi:hypothetical protein
LRRARSTHVVAGLRFEQLGVGENNPELVVQAVKEQAEI